MGISARLPVQFALGIALGQSLLFAAGGFCCVHGSLWRGPCRWFAGGAVLLLGCLAFEMIRRWVIRPEQQLCAGIQQFQSKPSDRALLLVRAQGAFLPLGAQVQRLARSLLEQRSRLAASESSLARSEQRFAWATRATDDVIWHWDLQNQTRWWSSSFQFLTGTAAPNPTQGQAFWLEHLHPHDRTSIKASLETALECQEKFWSAEYRFLRRNGAYAWIQDRAYIDYDPRGRPLHLVGAMTDTSRQKRADQELARLTGRIVEAQELERGRIARELHDSVNYMLAAAQFELRLLADPSVPASGLHSIHLARAIELLSKAIQEIRSISHDLRPSELDDLGLLPAVRETCQEFADRSGLKVHFQAEAFSGILSPEIELTVYRVVQEALANVEKHAQASEVQLRLWQEDGRVLAAVRDNGHGFGKIIPAPRRRSGFGLVNMKERAVFHGGNVSFNSPPPGGAEVLLSLPLAATLTST